MWIFIHDGISICSVLGIWAKKFTLNYSRDAEFSGIYRCYWFLRFVLGYVVLLQGSYASRGIYVINENLFRV